MARRANRPLQRRGVIAKRVVDGERCVRAVASETRGKVVPVRRKAEQLKWARSQTRKIKRGKAEPGAKFRDKKRLHRSKARHAISRSVPHSSFSAWSVAAERIKGASLARNLANTEHPPSSSSTSRRPIRKRSKAKRPSQEVSGNLADWLITGILTRRCSRVFFRTRSARTGLDGRNEAVQDQLRHTPGAAPRISNRADGSRTADRL